MGNLSWETSWQDLKDHFRAAGDVSHADVMQEHDGRSKGCGIVSFVSARGAAQAIAMLNQSELGGRVIFVREARAPLATTRGGALDTIVVPCGGGGMTAGICLSVEASAEDSAAAPPRVVTIEPAGPCVPSWRWP